ncbi:MAG: glutaredoxin domain-containing protein [bacterium]|nr:glutaredoxin domain-containing protein [bacterium]
MIKVYSTPTCPYCVTLKNFLKENNIQFEDIDVSQNEAAAKDMIDRSGQMGVPVVDIDGEMIVGFDQERIKKLLKIN